jgi:hypothetical protein
LGRSRDPASTLKASEDLARIRDMKTRPRRTIDKFEENILDLEAKKIIIHITLFQLLMG